MSASEGSSATERATLCEFLDYQREALIGKLRGLTAEQARVSPTASALSLLSLVKHSAIWERRWFQIIVAGRSFPREWPDVPDVASDEPNPTFRLTQEDTIETVVDDYRAQIAASNEILGSFDLDGRCVRSDKADETVRWVALHMIEETARHAGHADIIRETIDGTRGS
ncbi:MAG TPA: DinB family protein [Ilumatobacteraceae bacterium]